LSLKISPDDLSLPGQVTCPLPPDDEAIPPVPPRRSRGRHRRPKHTGGPAYVTAATLAAFTVSGMNVPGAIGDARQAASSTPTATATTADGARTTFAAVQLRNTLAAQQEERASRLRSAQAEAVAAYRKAAREARIAAEKARPKWVLPVSGFRLTAGFGEYGLWSSSHTGQDFACAYGTPVHAVGDGKIIFAAYDGSYGNKIAIEHPDGTVTWYAHMDSFVRTSGTVQAGDVIGRVGMTGNTTGAHLHLEVRPHDGPPVPPLTWLRQHGIAI
jgi:murein DD-endopeptidase MepM/ murein hydrolase activator NlpD